MKSNHFPLLICLAVICTLICMPNSAVAQEPPKPSPEHAILAKDVGKWKSVATIKTPEGEFKSEGIETNKMMGPFWMSSTLEYEMFGMKMIGHGMFGYDASKKKFVGIWTDGGNPYMSHMEGDWDADKSMWTYKMKTQDPTTGAAQNGKITIQMKGEKEKVFIMYMENPEKAGDFVEFMRMDYTRIE